MLSDYGRLLALPGQEVLEIVTSNWTIFSEGIVASLFSHTSDPKKWAAKITEFLGPFARYNGLAQLGDALVQHLPALAEKAALQRKVFDQMIGSKQWVARFSWLNFSCLSFCFEPNWPGCGRAHAACSQANGAFQHATK